MFAIAQKRQYHQFPCPVNVVTTLLTNKVHYNLSDFATYDDLTPRGVRTTLQQTPMDHTLATPPEVSMAASQPDPYESPSTYKIHKIEQEIERHTQIIVNLKVKRNSHLPIFKLPIELLCKVFQCVRDGWTTQYYSHPSSFPIQELAWIVVTHVCQHWRNVALSEPSLWTRPPLRYTKWTTVVLERSRMAGINISFNDGMSSMRTNQDLLTTVVSHLPHTSTLVLERLQKQVVQGLLKDLQSIVTPMLETLVVDGAYEPFRLGVAMFDGAASSDHDRTPTRLPENAFLGSTKLRRLSLTSIDIDWSSHLLSSLTDLTLEKISPAARPSRTEFLSILERNPRLRKLTLQDALPTPVHLANSLNAARPRIPLLSLENLNLRSEEVECEFFCNHVVIPDTIKSITQSYKYDHNNHRQLSKLLSALDEATLSDRLGSRSRSVKVLGELQLSALSSLSFSAGGRVSLRGFFGYLNDSIPDYCEPDISAPDLQFNLQSPSSSAPGGIDSLETSSAIFSEFFNGLHWDNLAQLVITGLQVSVYNTGFSATLATTFGTLPQLRAVFVGTACANYLIDALLINSDKDPGLVPDSITFPALCHIGLNAVQFDRYNNDDSLIMDRLLDCLMDRYERGVEIHLVSVDSCSFFGDGEVELLEEIVVEVDWDGEEHGYTDDEDEDDDEDDDEDPDFYEESDYEDEVYGFWDDY